MKLTRKILASVLALVMVLLMMPAAFAAEETTYVLDATADLTPFEKGDKEDFYTVTVHDYFTVLFKEGDKSAVNKSNKNFEDGYSATQRINFGGKTEPSKNMAGSVKFTTANAAIVSVWWVSGGNDRQMALYNAAGEVVTETTESVKDTLYISTFEAAEAGTYYVGMPQGNNYIFKIEVAEAAAEEPETPAVEMQVGAGRDAQNPLGGEPTSYTYTATESGKLTLAVARGIGSAGGAPVYASYTFNGGEPVEMVTTNFSDKTIIDMVAGDTVVVTATVENGMLRNLNARWDATIAYEADLVLGNNPFYADEDIVRTFTAPVDGTLTIKCAQAGGGFGLVASGTDVTCSYTINDGEIVEVTKNQETEIALYQGDVIVITVQPVKAGGTLTASWTEGTVEEPATELVMGNNPINGDDITYTYTAEKDGILTLNVNGPATVTPANPFNVNVSVNGGAATRLLINKDYTYELKSGDKVEIFVETTQTGSIAASWAEAEVVIPELVVDGTTKNPVNNDNASYTYTAPADGTLTLNCNKNTGSAIGGAGSAIGGAGSAIGGAGSAIGGAGSAIGGAGSAIGGAAAAQNFSYTVNGGTAVKVTNGKATNVKLNKGDVIVITADAGTTGTITASWADTPAGPVEKDLAAFNPTYENSSNRVSAGETIISYTATKDGIMGLQFSAVLGNANAVITASYSINGGEKQVMNTDPKVYTHVSMKAGDEIKIYVTADCDRNVNAYWCIERHNGGKATCTEQAICERCGQGYGELAEHTYDENGKCTVCGNPETGDIFGIMVALMAASGTALVCLKKKEN